MQGCESSIPCPDTPGISAFSIFDPVHRSNRPKKYEADDNPDPLVTSDTYVPWRTTARLQRNKYKTRNPIKSSPTDDLTSQPLRTVAEEKGAKDRTIIAGVGELSIEELGAEERYLDRKDIKELKVELTGLKRRYGNEVRQRAEIESRLREVEVENRKLKNEIVLLKSNGMVSFVYLKLKSRVVCFLLLFP